MTKFPEVISAGELFVDLILSGFTSWPQPGQEAFAQEFRREVGGGAAITACGLARLGHSVAVYGVVGTDWGAWMINSLNSNGVHTDWIEEHPSEPTAFTVVATVPHERTFLTYAGANRRFEPLLETGIAAGRFLGVRHVHLAYAPEIDTAEAIFERLHADGCTISVDFGWREEWLHDPRALSLLSKADVFLPNEIEAQQLSKETDPARILSVFRRAGLKRAAVKLGARGAGLLWDDEILFVPPRHVNAIDTTGAGDCFDAGFLHAWLNRESPAACLTAANICGALSTESYGGIAGFPRPEQLKREL